MNLIKGLSFTVLASSFLFSSGVAKAAILAPNTPYLSFNDSPFSSGNFDYFFLEDFEDASLNTPGVSANTGGPTSIVFGPAIHDSVDADDGVIDGSGLEGDSYFTSNGSGGIVFTFSANVLGALPDVAGLVWTDGAGGATFRAFGPGGTLLGSVSAFLGDGSNSGETAEDRFFGIEGLGAIESISITGFAGGLEIDHLQYGLSSAEAIPTPALLPGLIGMGVAALRKKGRKEEVAGQEA